MLRIRHSKADVDDYPSSSESEGTSSEISGDASSITSSPRRTCLRSRRNRISLENLYHARDDHSLFNYFCSYLQFCVSWRCVHHFSAAKFSAITSKIRASF